MAKIEPPGGVGPAAWMPLDAADLAALDAADGLRSRRIEEGYAGTLAGFAAWLAGHLAVPVTLDRPSLELEGVDPTAEIDLTGAVGLTAADLMQVAAHEVGGGFAELAWVDQHGGFRLTTADYAGHNLAQTRMYPVADLIADLRLLSLRQAARFGWPENRGMVGTIDYDDAVEQIVESLIDHVDEDSWRDSGGTIGGISEVGGILIIEQLPQTHREVTAYLEALRATMRASLDALPPPPGVSDADLLRLRDRKPIRGGGGFGF